MPESLAGLDGREQQLQYQALLSFTADWITDRRAAVCRRRSRLCRTGTFFFLSPRLSRTDILFFFFFFELNTKDSSSGSRGRGLKRFACAPMYSLQAGSGPFLLAVLAGLQVRLSPSGLFHRTFQSAASSPGMFVELEARANWLPPSGHFERRAVDSGGVLHPRWVQIRAVIVRVWPSASLANLASLCWGGASYAQLNKALIIPRLGNTPP